MSNVRHRILKYFLKFSLFWRVMKKVTFYIKEVYSNTQETLLSMKPSCGPYRNVRNRMGFGHERSSKLGTGFHDTLARTTLSDEKYKPGVSCFSCSQFQLKFQALQRSQNSVRALYKADKMDIAWVRPKSRSGCPSACINTKSKRQTDFKHYSYQRFYLSSDR